jgi:superfamily II DNA/RNA helicase
MYKNTGSKNRRYSRTRNNKRSKSSSGGYGRNSSSSKNYRSNWKRKNRKLYRENISRSMYISKATEIDQGTTQVSDKTFSDYNLHGKLVQNISARGYETPTKIQDKAIPEVLAGKDVLGIGNTGSGKTGAFLIPLTDKALKNPNEKVLIVTPTRELASQIYGEFRKFSKETKLRMVLVIGGKSIRDQIRLLKNRPQFVVATPGRLMDIEKRRCISLKTFSNVVLDEVDQMLDMGFVEDMKTIISKLAEKRQALFFSATMNAKAEVLANTLLRNPIKIDADKHSPLKRIHQDIVRVKSKEHKTETLHTLLLKKDFSKVLVFSRTKHGADRLSNELRSRGVKVDSLHGNKSQNRRASVLANFRQNRINVLIATDVAARGIDVPDITHVINFDEPANYTDYIHRIGRTGRIGKTGTALTFVLS